MALRHIFLTGSTETKWQRQPAFDRRTSQRFVEQIDERIRTEREIKIPHPKASLSKLVHLAAEGME
jgi:hypothetical protein